MFVRNKFVTNMVARRGACAVRQDPFGAHIHGQTLHGAQQIATAAGMGIVALGAGIGLLRRRAVQA
jgi:hypothetical protein